jgi:hypothetical protein
MAVKRDEFGNMVASEERSIPKKRRRKVKLSVFLDQNQLDQLAYLYPSQGASTAVRIAVEEHLRRHKE